ncbi:MAG TPA: CBS domain-containing protein [Jatrophihabitans sp.]|jgi:CBS-domain-containing membrane protein|nr:CBS domain-containing protein [Jatrophihabitans sp.]
MSTQQPDDTRERAEQWRAERAAAASAVGHRGPTADRYHSALSRYVEAVAAGEVRDPAAGPVAHLSFPPLTVGDVMTRDTVTAYPGAPFKEIAAALERNRIGAVPVVDEAHRVIGVVTASDLLARIAHARAVPRGHRASHAETSRKEHGRIARELMTAPPITTTAHTSIADAARRLARHRVRSMPVVDADGALTGMVSRTDLVKLFLRPDAEIHAEVLRNAMSRAGHVPDTLQVEVVEGVVTLSGHVPTALAARRLGYAASTVAGVVGVRNDLSFDVDDTYLPLSP